MTQKKNINFLYKSLMGSCGHHRQGRPKRPSIHEASGRTDRSYHRKVCNRLSGLLAYCFIDKEKMNRCNDEKVIELGRKKMEEYIFSHPPIATLPKFYIVFLNQPQIGCDTHGLSDVFCV